MQVIVRSIESYALVTQYTFEVDDHFDAAEQNAIRFLKDIRRKHKVSGKAFLITFPTVVYYVYREKKNDFKLFKIS